MTWKHGHHWQPVVVSAPSMVSNPAMETSEIASSTVEVPFKGGALLTSSNLLIQNGVSPLQTTSRMMIPNSDNVSNPIKIIKSKPMTGKGPWCLVVLLE